jgi:hypothetical protein
MSRAPTPKPNGEPPEHRIQVPTEHVEWLKGKIAAKKNGVKTLAALCRVLMAREFERLGITDELVLEEEAGKGSAPKRPRRKTKRV